MNTESMSPITDLDQPEVAFAAIGTRLAGLTAAIDGFAARQQEIHARDYSEDLGRIQLRQDAVRSAVLKLAARPAMDLTPAEIASQIEQAGANARAEDHAVFNSGHRQLGQAIRSIEGIVASAVTAREQKRWIAGAAATAILVGFVLGAIVPSWIDRAVPASWQWPEQRAAKLLNRDPWDAGIHLLQVSDPKQFRVLEAATQPASGNTEQLSDCRARTGKRISCDIKVRKPTVE